MGALPKAAPMLLFDFPVVVLQVERESLSLRIRQNVRCSTVQGGFGVFCEEHVTSPALAATQRRTIYSSKRN